MWGGRVRLGTGLAIVLVLALAAPAPGGTRRNIHALRYEAYRLYNAGKYHEAITVFDEVLKVKRWDTDSYAKRGNCYLRLDMPEQAIADYNEAIRLANQASFLSNTLLAAESGYLPGPVPQNPVGPEPAPVANRGIALAMLGRYEEALQDFQAAIVLHQGNFRPGNRKFMASPYTGIGDVTARMGRDDLALQAYDKAILLYPRCTIGYYGRGAAHAGLGHLDQALADLTTALRLDRELAGVDEPHRLGPRVSRVHDTRGCVLAQLGKTEPALADFTRAIELDPKFASAYKNRGGLLVRLGLYQAAVRDLDRAIELDPRRATSYQNRAAAFNSLGQYERAIEDCNQALQLDRTNAEVLGIRASARLSLGWSEEAMRDLDEAIRLAPRSAMAYLNRGVAYAKLGQHDRAIADYLEAARLKPDAPGTYVGLGNAHQQLGQHQEALRDFSSALRLDPNDAGIYCNRGNVRRVLDDWKGAIADFTEALRLDPKHADAYLARGWSRLATGRPGAEAEADARAYLKLNGARTPAAPYMGLLGAFGARRAGREAVAKVFLEEAAANTPPSAWPAPVLAYFRGELSADALMAAAADDRARLTEAHAFLGFDRLLAGDRAAALEHLRWARDQGDGRSMATDLARATLRQLEGTTTAP